MQILKFSEVYKDYIWGGERMRSLFGASSDADRIAESWVLSSHPDGESRIRGGEADGVLLSEYLREKPELLGTSRRSDELPVLIKFIDAKSDLSVQVHPTDALACELEGGGAGKTEMWYVIDCDEGARICCGFRRELGEAELRAAVSEERLEDELSYFPSRRGEVFFIPAGTVHAIGGGNFIAEIQQNSNITYRLYDYGRRDKNGNSRELHLEKGIRASDPKPYEKREPKLIADGVRELASCEFFEVFELKIKRDAELFADEHSFLALVCTEGEFSLGEISLKAGECAFIPAGYGEIRVLGKGTLLLTKLPTEE